MTQPTGKSGDRIACGVIVKSVGYEEKVKATVYGSFFVERLYR